MGTRSLKFIDDYLMESARVKQLVIKKLDKKIEEVSHLIVSALKRGNKLLLCGCGGSAADCQHIAGEFINRFKSERAALPAISLTTDSSVLTCISNDYSFDKVFSRQLEALAKRGDVLIAITTSGNSRSVINAAIAAREKGVKVVALTGETGGAIKGFADYLLNVPSKDTPIIQEAHISIAHIICYIVEKEYFRR